MQQLALRFLAVMTDEKSLYEELLPLGMEKKEAITKNDIETLDRIVKEEQVFLGKVNERERVRKQLVGELAAHLKKPASEISMQDFLPSSPPEVQEKLKVLHRELGVLLQKHADLNELNRKLIESRLEFINYTLNAVVQDDTPSHIYGGAGAASDPQRVSRNMIDRKA